MSKEETTSICGENCCQDCPRLNGCGGCQKTDGHPFGGRCEAAGCVKELGLSGLKDLKATLIKEINSLGIEGLKVEALYMLNWNFIKLEYELENHQKVKFLNDRDTYFGSQIKLPGGIKCLGVTASKGFIIVSRYGIDGSCPELVLYVKRPLGLKAG